MQRSSPYIYPLMAAILIGGFVAMYWLIHAFPLQEGSMVTHGLYTLVLIALGLAIPYWALKLGIHKSHMIDPKEKEMELSDIPKNKDDYAA